EVGFAAHDGGDAGGVVAASGGVVGVACGHQKRSEICVAQAQRAVVMRVAHDLFRGIAGVVYDDFLGGDENVYGVAVGFHVEGAVGGELQQVQAGQVAGRVVEEHVFAARIAGVDARGVLRGVPAVDGGVVLHAGIAAVPGGFRDFLQKIFGLVGLHHAAVAHGLGGE